MAGPRILVTLPDTPWPTDSGKRVRQWANLRALCELGLVDVLVLFSSHAAPQPPPGIVVHRFESVGPQELGYFEAATRLAVGRPWSVARKRWDRVRETIAENYSGRYDLVWFGGIDHAIELHGSVLAGAVIVDMDDVETEKVRAYLQLPRGRSAAELLTAIQRRIELPMWARIQRQVCQRADRVLVCSQDDAQILGTPNAVVLPNCYPGPSSLPAQIDRSTGSLLLIGNFAYEPNVDAAEFAVREVLPLVRAKLPDARLRLVGRSGKEALAGLAGCPGVDVVGPVPATEPELLTAAAVLVPVRWGGGTRVKIAEAFAFGAPVVSTSLGCAGYPVEDGREILIRDDPEGIAEGCLAVMSDPSLSARLAAAGRSLYERSYTPDAIARRVDDLVGGLLSGCP